MRLSDTHHSDWIRIETNNEKCSEGVRDGSIQLYSSTEGDGQYAVGRTCPFRGEALLRSTPFGIFEGCPSAASSVAKHRRSKRASLSPVCAESGNTAITNLTKQIRECEAIKLRLSNDAKDVAQLESLLHAC
jgi:hypothetical protein